MPAVPTSSLGTMSPDACGAQRAPAALGEVIREACRQQRGLAAALARHIGLRHSRLYVVLKDPKRLRSAQIEAIAKFFETTPEALQQAAPLEVARTESAPQPSRPRRTGAPQLATLINAFLTRPRPVECAAPPPFAPRM